MNSGARIHRLLSSESNEGSSVGVGDVEDETIDQVFDELETRLGGDVDGASDRAKSATRSRTD